MIASERVLENKAHRYYFINRPPLIGTHPAGESARKCFDCRQYVAEINHSAHGWAEWSEPLDFEQMWRYDLFPADKQEQDAYYDWRDEVEQDAYYDWRDEVGQ